MTTRRSKFDKNVRSTSIANGSQIEHTAVGNNGVTMSKHIFVRKTSSKIKKIFKEKVFKAFK